MYKIIVFLLCVFLTSCATFSDSGKYYRQANSFAKNKDYDVAFLKLRMLLNNNPRSPYAPKAAFTVAEYYFESGDYFDAIIAFRKYINAYPKDKGVIFAELMIYKMATQVNPNKNIPFNERYFLDSIRKKMFAKPVFFIFTENKEIFSYRSAFDNIYSAFDYVDKVKVMRNDELFFELSP
ncbi:MAG: outer membrane protein assembly factor BamD [Candidatus Omnitrophica bacterium]|nr:outer membrane protein assembly factor BamD [Candidatus Omnitrophota bacterium]